MAVTCLNSVKPVQGIDLALQILGDVLGKLNFAFIILIVLPYFFNDLSGNKKQLHWSNFQRDYSINQTHFLHIFRHLSCSYSA